MPKELFVQINDGSLVLWSGESSEADFIISENGISFVPLDWAIGSKLSKYLGKNLEMIVGQQVGDVKFVAISEAGGFLDRLHFIRAGTESNWREGF